MIVSLIGMNAIVLIGFFSGNSGSFSLSQKVAPPAPPVVTLSANPTEIASGLFSALSWDVTGEITGCSASGDWIGPKTQFGSESTGRLNTEGVKTYTLTCENSGGKSTASTVVTVKKSVASTSQSTSTSANTSSPKPAAPKVYCNGASPCYGPREVASHNGAGNCWGWNGSRVMNISGFDTGYHKGKSGIGSIEVSGVCGKDLAASLAGNVSAGGQTRDHNASTKANADRNMLPYFVGYFDNTKP